MKKLFVVMMAVLMAVSFAACSKDKDSDGKSSKTGTCSACGKEEVKVKTVEYNGQKADLCADCAKEFQEFLNEQEGTTSKKTEKKSSKSSSKGTCMACGKKNVKTSKVEYLGQKFDMCADCAKEAKEAEDALNSFSF